MFEPIQYESLDFRTRCQIRRIESLTGEPRDEVIRNAIDGYFQKVMATVTNEQLEAERTQFDEGSRDPSRRASWLQPSRGSQR